MQPVEFIAAASAGDARAAHGGRADARFLAGGTTLVDLMKAGVERPGLVVDINGLPLTSVSVEGDGVRLGALARNSDVAYDATVAREFPAVAQALLSGASGQLRNMATVGGNLLQRTRCPYFREPHYRCNKRAPGSGCDALEGFNRSHAILGGSDACIAAHPSDFAVALVAADASVVVQTASGERSVSIVDFYRLPGDRPDIETTLEGGDLVVGVDLQCAPLYRRSAYVKLRDRASYEFALASAAVALEIEGGVVRAARVALGGVATVPWRARGAEAVLEGAAADAAVFARAADAAVEGAVPRAHNAFKIELVRRAVMRALATVAEAP